MNVQGVKFRRGPGCWKHKCDNGKWYLMVYPWKGNFSWRAEHDCGDYWTTVFNRLGCPCARMRDAVKDMLAVLDAKFPEWRKDA